MEVRSTIKTLRVVRVNETCENLTMSQSIKGQLVVPGIRRVECLRQVEAALTTARPRLHCCDLREQQMNSDTPRPLSRMNARRVDSSDKDEVDSEGRVP